MTSSSGERCKREAFLSVRGAKQQARQGRKGTGGAGWSQNNGPRDHCFRTPSDAIEISRRGRVGGDP